MSCVRYGVVCILGNAQVDSIIKQVFSMHKKSHEVISFEDLDFREITDPADKQLKMFLMQIDDKTFIESCACIEGDRFINFPPYSELTLNLKEFITNTA